MAGSPPRSEVDRRKAEDEKPLLAPHSNSEFKFFDLVEDTLVGLAAFLLRLGFLLKCLTLNPARMASLKTEYAEKIPRPFTFLGLASVVAALEFHRLYVFAKLKLNFFMLGQPEALLTPSIIDSLQRLSWTDALKVSIPVVAIVLSSAALLLRVLGTGPRETRLRALHLHCYGTGFQLLATAIALILFERLAFKPHWLASPSTIDGSLLFEEPIFPIAFAYVAIYTPLLGVFLIRSIYREFANRRKPVIINAAVLLIYLILPLLCFGVVVAANEIGLTSYTGIEAIW